MQKARLLIGALMLIFPAMSYANTTLNIEVTPKTNKVVLYEQEPFLVYGEEHYSIGYFFLHIVITNISNKDQTLYVKPCNTLDLMFYPVSLRQTMDGCNEDGNGTGTVKVVVLRSKEKFEGDVKVAISENNQAGDMKFKVGYYLGFLDGVLTEEWSDNVSITFVEGTEEQKKIWEEQKNRWEKNGGQDPKKISIGQGMMPGSP